MKSEYKECEKTKCRFYDKTMELNCCYSDDNSKCYYETISDGYERHVFDVENE